MFSCLKLLMGVAGEEQVGIILCCADQEILQYKYEWPTILKIIKTESKLHFV
jgi:hypothetical protein